MPVEFSGNMSRRNGESKHYALYISFIIRYFKKIVGIYS